MDKKLQVYKNNIVLLAKHHKEHCSGDDCQISLIMLRMFAEEGGIKFTNKEKEIFT